MDLIYSLIVWAVFGLIAGAIARFLVPGRQSMSLLATMVLGIIGSFVGGFLASLLTGTIALTPSGFILSILGAVIALAIYLYMKRDKHAAAV
ncbi:GlsB/YeaQ/YmgE family stress response membrane protein [Botrimarina sp.]|uniref:GlsB/YeaQ/YmgE family stress response membrane protein n=1 Tax=Botrimarina sp. TaxID=2795802 RepID=UPI0032EB368D